MNEHEHFEELCAVVASGLASAEEFQEFENHVQRCDECRERFGDFMEIGAGILSEKKDREPRAPAGMTKRFVVRAMSEGISLRKPTRILPTWASRHPILWSGTIAASVLLLFLVLGNIQRITTTVHQGGNNAASHAPASPAPTRSTVAAERGTEDDSAKQLQAAFNAATADKRRLEQALADLNNELAAKTAHGGELTVQVAALEKQLDQMKQAASAKDAEITDLSSQLKRRQDLSTDQLASLAEDQLQIRDLRDQLAQRDAMVQDQRQLLAAGSQARDLIIARNLHIIDVHDNNGEGERQRAFGRIFYTEGKQIVFYAYDLESAAKLKKQVAFYVWGGKLGDEHAVKNLGVFRNEDAGAGRWVLTFDDPRVLAEINTVFVTAESKKNVERPDGKQILFAYLGDKANHP